MKLRARRGANALEFALTLPILLAILSGVIDYSYLLHLQFSMVNAVSQGARAASATDYADGPLAVATTVVNEVWTLSEFDSFPTVTATEFTLSNGDLAVQVTAEVPYEPLVGFLPTPATVSHTAIMRLDDQP